MQNGTQVNICPPLIVSLGYLCSCKQVDDSLVSARIVHLIVDHH